MRSSRSVPAAISLFVMLAAGCGGLSRGKPSPDAGCVPGVDETFAAEVHPILIERCAGCHGVSSSRSFTLGGDAGTDRSAALGFADLAAPERSPFLLKAAGNGHGGGSPIPSSSAEYATILRWLRGDARVELRDCAADGGDGGTGGSGGSGGGDMDAAVDGSLGDGGSLPDAELPDATVPDAAPHDGAMPGPRFATDIHALLTDDCVPCHASGGPAASSALQLTAVPGDDYAGVRSLVDVDDAASSALLQEASGNGHGGGTRFATDSSEYALLIEWIEAGALP